MTVGFVGGGRVKGKGRQGLQTATLPVNLATAVQMTAACDVRLVAQPAECEDNGLLSGLWRKGLCWVGVPLDRVQCEWPPGLLPITV